MVDLLQDDCRLGDPEPGTAVLLGDEGAQPAGLRERLDELLWIFGVLVQLAPVGVREALAQLAHGSPNLLMLWIGAEVHGALLVAAVILRPQPKNPYLVADGCFAPLSMTERVYTAPSRWKAAISSSE